MIVSFSVTSIHCKVIQYLVPKRSMAGTDLWLLSGVFVPSYQRWQSTQDVLTRYLAAVDRTPQDPHLPGLRSLRKGFCLCVNPCVCGTYGELS